MFLNVLQKNYIQLLSTLIGTLSGLTDGMQNGWTAPNAAILLSPNSPITTTRNQLEWLETIFMIGAFCSLPITMYLVDKIGRKKSLLLAALISLITWSIIAVSKRIEYVLFARFIAGATSTISFVAAPLYIAEIANTKIRGFLSSILYLAEVIGVLLIYAIVPFVEFYIPPLIAISINLFELLVFPYMPDSPYYLLYKNQPEKAEKALCNLRRQKDVSEEFRSISIAVEQMNKTCSFKDLLTSSHNRKALLIVGVLNASQHMSSFTVLLMNSHSILNAAESCYIDTSIAAIIFSGIMLVSGTCSSFLMDSFGRRKLLITSGLLCGFSLLSIAIYFSLKKSNFVVDQISWLPAVAIMSYAAAFKFGLGLVPIVLTGELFASHMKAVGATIADCLYIVFSIISLQIYYLLVQYFGFDVPFYLFSCCCFCTVIFTVFYIPETKGKTLDEIQNIIKENNIFYTIK